MTSALNTSTCRTASALVVEPVTPTIGAEISGVDLARPLDAATLDTVKEALHLKEPESDALIGLLYQELIRPEYAVRFRWRPNSLVVWDNQAVAHAGPIDYGQFDLPRVVRRITVAGEPPQGPDGFRSRPLEGELFNVIG